MITAIQYSCGYETHEKNVSFKPRLSNGDISLHCNIGASLRRLLTDYIE